MASETPCFTLVAVGGIEPPSTAYETAALTTVLHRRGSRRGSRTHPLPVVHQLSRAYKAHPPTRADDLIGADDGTRTHDLLLGKQELFH